jgi:hypothetical protein
VTDQSEAQITAEPTLTNVNTILNANTNIKAAFTASGTPSYFGIGELGGLYPTSGSGSVTETSAIGMTVNLTKLSSLHDLLIGLYGGTALGSAASDPAFSMKLDVNIDGVDHTRTFTTVASANSFFQNNAVDYGALSGSGTSLQLDISLLITESAATNGYDFGMLIGDPPSAADIAAHHNMVAAMASFGVNASGSQTLWQISHDDHHETLVPVHSGFDSLSL